jgi:hypothetical protein
MPGSTASTNGTGMFNVRFYLLVVGATESHYAYRDATLPFAPFPGLSVKCDDDDDKGKLIAEVTWEVKNRRFVASLEPRKNKALPIEEELALLRTNGWTVEPSR